MILTDAGPLIALADAGDLDHEKCVAALDDVRLPMVATWPAFTEAMYLLGASGGWPAQQALWALVEQGILRIHDLDEQATARSAALMGKYADTPMDLADATLVAAAEVLGTDRIFTIDRDFHVYRMRNRKGFKLIP